MDVDAEIREDFVRLLPQLNGKTMEEKLEHGYRILMNNDEFRDAVSDAGDPDLFVDVSRKFFKNSLIEIILIKVQEELRQKLNDMESNEATRKTK